MNDIVFYYLFTLPSFVFHFFNSSHELKTENSSNEDRLKIYQYLQLVNKGYNDCTSYIFQPTFQVAIALEHITGLYTCIKLYDVIPMPGFLEYPLVTFCLFLWMGIVDKGAGKVHTESIKFLQNFKGDSAYLKKKLKSLPSLNINVGSFYQIREQTIIQYGQIVFDNTVSLLLL